MLDEPYGGWRRSDELGGVFNAEAERYSQDELDAALVRLAELDASLKGGSRLSGQLELTRALVDLAAGASASART